MPLVAHQGLAGGSRRARRERRVPGPTQVSIGSVEDTGFILKGFGNACRWADLDGNGTQDLVVATHGGRVVWFSNASSGSIPDLPLPPPSEPQYGAPTGELVYPLAQPPVDLGWDGDLGTTMMAMEIANLDSASDDEVLVGTFFDVDPAHPEHYRLGGSVYAIGMMTGGSDSLEVLDSIPLDYGVCGLHVMPYAVSPPPPMIGPTRRYVAAGTARGRVYVLEYDPARMAGDRFHVVYRSRFYAPMAGAYNAIRSFPIGDPANRQFRVVFGSSGGIFAFDITMPADFTPGPEVTCTPP